MTNPSVETSPQVYARVGGVLYLITIVLGAVGELFVRGSIVVPGDATATAAMPAASSKTWKARSGWVWFAASDPFDGVDKQTCRS